MHYKIFAVLALLVAIAAPAAAADDSYIIRADQIKGGTLGPSVTIDPAAVPSNVLTTGEVLASGAVVVTDNGDGTITVEAPTKAADASLLNGAAESTAADANTIAKRDANADLAVRRIVSALATGTSPFSILSTTLNTNLNADLLDGLDASAFLGVSAQAADSALLNGAADATSATASTIAKRDANADITARRFISGIATGTSPLSVASTTLNSNLNADLLDGLEATAFLGATATAADSTKINGYTLDTSNTSNTATAYYYFDGTTLSIKRKALADVIAEVGGGGGLATDAFVDTSTITWATTETEARADVAAGVYLPVLNPTVQGDLKLNSATQKISGLVQADTWGPSATALTSITGVRRNIGGSGDSTTFYATRSLMSNGLYKTTDSGASWAQIPISGVATSLYLQDLAISGNVIVTSGQTTAGAATTAYFRSADGGATWTEYAFPNSGIWRAIVATGSGYFAAISYDGTVSLFSNNGGLSFSFVQNLSFSASNIREIECAPGTNNVFACGAAGPNRIIRSVDGGASWGPYPAPNASWVGQAVAHLGGDTWVMVGQGSSSTYNIIRTTNGSSFSEVLALSGIVFGSACGAATGTYGFAFTTTGGTYWTQDSGASWAIQTTSGIGSSGVVCSRLGAAGNKGAAFNGSGTSCAFYLGDVAVGIAIDAPLTYIKNLTSIAGTAVHIDTVTGKLSYSASSLRFKDDVAPFVLDWDRFLALEPLTFTEKATGEKGKLGFAAETTAPLYPGEVPLDAEGLPFSVDYERLVVPAVAAIKEIKHERDADAGEIRALRAENADLRRRLEAIEAVVGAGR